MKPKSHLFVITNYTLYRNDDAIYFDISLIDLQEPQILQVGAKYDSKKTKKSGQGNLAVRDRSGFGGKTAASYSAYPDARVVLI